MFSYKMTKEIIHNCCLSILYVPMMLGSSLTKMLPSFPNQTQNPHKEPNKTHLCINLTPFFVLANLHRLEKKGLFTLWNQTYLKFL